MAFDQPTRNRLQRFVNDARRVLEEEFTRQLQNDFGLDPNSGSVAELASLRHINDAQRETARILRDTLAHYSGQWSGAGGQFLATDHRSLVTELQRILREQAFTVLNRLAALRMAEARGLLVESVGNGFQAKGFQLYARLTGTGLGETGDAYRVYLFSLFDELAQDLPGLFDRYSPQGRLFPREAALLQVLNLINADDIAQLWGEDETIGWIYQYFNSKEERKAMRDASQAPRNSRELAVRNQFFTPRYVVEFLVDNSLGRLWFNATGGQTDLRERCQYLLVASGQWSVASGQWSVNSDQGAVVSDQWSVVSGQGTVNSDQWSVNSDQGIVDSECSLSTNHRPPATDHRPPATDHRPPATDYRPPATDYRPPATDHRPPATDYRPPATDYRPPATDYRPPATDYRPPATDYRPPATDHRPLATDYRPPATDYRPPATDYRPPATDYRPPATDYRPPATDYRPPATDHRPLATDYRPPATDYRPPATALRDPRTLKLLDPACGSMHFGLYAFDLFVEIYREAWAMQWSVVGDRWGAVSEAEREGLIPEIRSALLVAGWENGTGFSTSGHRPLIADYSSEAAFLRDVPRLIIEHNLYGVDIDPRAAQIASLALWLRAQRAWFDAGVKAKERPLIGRGHVIAATAPPAEKALRQQFAATLDHLDAELFTRTLQLLKGVPEMGVLLQVERELPKLIKEVFGEHGGLFKEADLEQWHKAEARLRQALTDFAQAAQASYQGRLFARDALEGLRLIELCREVFDVVVMNPPFGALAANTKDQLSKAYPRSKNDLLAIMVERGLELLRAGGRIGAITSRTCFFLSSYQKWREQVVLGIARPEVMADLGHGVMDDAMVEAAAYVLEKQP